MNVLDAACWFASKGIYSFPVEPRGKAPIGSLVPNGKDDATLDLPTLNRWFAKRSANIGIACGPSNIVTVDIDVPKPKNKMTSGRDELARLVDELGPLPETVTADTGSGGEHRLFLAPLGIQLVGKLGRAIDLIRNGYIVAPPSEHESGSSYRWRDGLSLDEVPLAQLPQSWLDYAKQPEPSARPALEQQSRGDDFYSALESLDQRYVLECLSGSSIVGGERFTFKRTSRGKHNLFVDKGDGFEATSNFVDSNGRIGARDSGANDSGPLASTWLRFYTKDDKAIRKALVELVPTLGQFGPSAKKTKANKSKLESEPTTEEAAASGSDEPPQDPPDDSRERSRKFDRDENGKIYPSRKNIKIALEKLGVTVKYDRFAELELISGLDGFGPELDDKAMDRLWLKIEHDFKFRPAREYFFVAISDIAQSNAFHPVRDYLNSLTWDGRERISRWLRDYAGAADDAYTCAVSRIMLVAAVRRVRQPGCKFDEMPILEGVQGTNKSTGLKVMAVRHEWFADDLPLGADTKRFMEAIQGRWIVEAGELKGMSQGDVAQLKATLSRTVDRARLSYGRKNTVMDRRCLIVGTTNETSGYLRDATGNRRFWPVLVNRFNIEELERDRDQLWAEAAHYEAQGESIRLAQDLWSDAAREQESREQVDPFEFLLKDAFGDITGKIWMGDVWRIVGIQPGDATQDQNRRLGSTMQKLGWTRSRRRTDGGREYCYLKGDDEREISVEVERRFSGDGHNVTVTRRW